MKKMFAILLCLTLAMSLLLTGCGSEKDALIGTWKGTYDITGYMNEALSGIDPELGQYLRISEFTFSYTLTFNEDDTYVMRADRDSIQASVDTMMADMEAGLIEYLEYVLNAQGLDISVEEFMESAGLSIDSLMAEALPGDAVESMASSMDMQGKFEAMDGKLYLSDSYDTVPDHNLYEIYTLEGNTLTIDAGTALEDETVAEIVYPMVLTKVEE